MKIQTIVHLMLNFNFLKSILIVMLLVNCKQSNSQEKKDFHKITTSEFTTIYNSLNMVTLPLKYSYEFLAEEPDFKSVPKEWGGLLSLSHFEDYSAIKLPAINTKIKPFLLSAFDKKGQSILYMYILSDNGKITDKLELYYSYDTDLGNIVTIYDISKDYNIKTTKIEYDRDSENILEAKNYIIAENGKFREIKK